MRFCFTSPLLTCDFPTIFLSLLYTVDYFCCSFFLFYFLFLNLLSQHAAFPLGNVMNQAM